MKSSKTKKKKQELQNRARGPTTALFLKLSRKAHGAPPFFLIYELGPSDEVSSLILFCCSFVTSVYFFLCVFFFFCWFLLAPCYAFVRRFLTFRISKNVPRGTSFVMCIPFCTAFNVSSSSLCASSQRCFVFTLTYICFYFLFFLS